MAPHIYECFTDDLAVFKNALLAQVGEDFGEVLAQSARDYNGDLLSFDGYGSATILLGVDVITTMVVDNPPKSVVVLKSHNSKELLWLRSRHDLRDCFVSLAHLFTGSSTELGGSVFRSYEMFMRGVYVNQTFAGPGLRSSARITLRRHASPAKAAEVSDDDDPADTIEVRHPTTMTSSAAFPSGVVKRGRGRPRGSTNAARSATARPVGRPHKDAVKNTAHPLRASVIDTTLAPTTFPPDYRRRILAVLRKSGVSPPLKTEWEANAAILPGFTNLSDADKLVCAAFEVSDVQEYITKKHGFFSSWKLTLDTFPNNQIPVTVWSKYIATHIGKHNREPKGRRLYEMFDCLGWLDITHFT